ncbi:MAG TPA: hypothetical protein VH643_26370 [Gemmataceae bacterium]|jgi:hypothetical protein
MASSDDSALHISWPGIITLLVAVLGLIISHPSLESERPTPVGGDGKSLTPDGSIPARLWQDPLAATLRVSPSERTIASIVSDAPRPADGREETGDGRPKPVLFLFDCLPAENSPEAMEIRRRERYATLSALSTAGYAPIESDRLHFASLIGKRRKDGKGMPAAGDSGGTRDDLRPEEAGLLIPYEWAGPLEEESKAAKDARAYQAVCTLWVSLLPDASRQLPLLRALRQALNSQWPKNGPRCRFAITGRIGSSQLAAMLRTDAPFADPGREAEDGITFYVTNSTAPFVRKLAPRARGLVVEYVIDTDQRLASSLIEELDNRRLRVRAADDTNPIAVVAEWDTDYGRQMHQLFDEAISPLTNGAGQHADGQPPKGHRPHVHHYSYLRGLDGKVLGGAVPKASPSTEAGSVPEGGPKPETAKPSAREGEGEPQIDYLRRLVGRMKADHEQYKAIAIVGSDVYDKLLLMRALRPSFPEAVFLTTDLDVRLLQPADFSTTRNLLIASHYGLSLNKDLQQKVAPFRSSYDTASYLGCLRAVHFPKVATHLSGSDDSHKDIVALVREQLEGEGEGAKVPPNVHLLVPQTDGSARMPVHLSVVGRQGPYELTLRTQDPVGESNGRVRPWVARQGRPWLLLGVAVVVGLLLYPVSRQWQGFLNWTTTPARALAARLRPRAAPCPAGGADARERTETSRKNWHYLGAFLAAVLGVALAALIYYAHTHEGGEPFELFAGISVWPTVILRLLACGLCVYYIVTAGEDLVKRNDGIRDEFGLAPPKDEPAVGWPGDTWAAFRLGCRAWAREPQKAAEVSKLYEEFAAQGSFGGRAWRTGLMAVINLVLFVLLWLVFNPTVLQARGDIARTCYVVVLLVTLVTGAGLLMFVVDCTLLSYRFVTCLVRQEERTWPPTLVEGMARRWGLLLRTADGTAEVPQASAIKEAASQWLLIHLIDQVTNVVARLIYYPFVVLLVLIVAQNRLFDDWHWNVPWALMALFNAGAAVVCGVMLQRAAKRAKGKALEALDGLLRERAGAGDDPLRDKFVQIRTDIEGTRTGAFASWSQNPVVGAILLPLFGGGGLAALEMLLAYLH